MINFSVLRDELVITLVVSVLIIFYLSKTTDHTLFVIIIIIAFYVIAYIYFNDKSKKLQNNNINDKEYLKKHLENRQSLDTQNVPLIKIPKKGLKFIEENPDIVEIIKDLKFTRIFDKHRYGDLIVMLNQMQKVYMYILAERYEPKTYIDTFNDITKNIMENISSMYFVVPPDELKHTYGVNPYKKIKENFKRFVLLKTKMQQILHNYMRLGRNIQIIPDFNPEAYQK